MSAVRSLWILSFALAACGSPAGSTGPVAPAPSAPPNLLGDAESGEALFAPSCAHCHASADGFDLALFGYTSFDLVRRALAHVDSTDSRDIAAYIESLPVSPIGRRAAVFQPDGKAESDLDFWQQLFGTRDWPTGLTGAALRAIDPRETPVPLGFPLWSDDGSDEDWMPDAPIPADVLEADGALVRQGLSAYYAQPTEGNLVHVLERFRAATSGGGRVCWLEDPRPCFDARRWMASLAAQHYLRSGEPASVPHAVAQVWWDVGDSQIAMQSVARNAEERASAFRSGARWMYLGFSFAPEAFDEPDEYMGTFLRSQGLYRVTLFATLRRMVGDGPAHARNPSQFLIDGLLAIRRTPQELGLEPAEFVFEHFVDRLETSPRSPDLDLEGARMTLQDALSAATRWASSDPTRWTRVVSLYQRALALLD